MLSFKPIENKGDIEKIAKGFDLPCGASESFADFLALCLEEAEDFDTSIAATFYDGCALIRVFDMGRYYFLPPEKILPQGDVKNAFDAVLEYAKREELPFVFHSVPRDMLSDLLDGVRHADIDAEGPFGDSFCLKIKTECELTEEIFSAEEGDFEIRALENSDASVYKELCTDKELNKYYGYQISDDHPDMPKEDYIAIANAEFERGVALTLALVYKTRTVGDAIFYAFDGKGGAELAIRILSNMHGKGLGSRFLSLLLDYGRDMGLIRVMAFVKRENLPSVRMCGKFMKKEEVDEGRVKFLAELYNA